MIKAIIFDINGVLITPEIPTLYEASMIREDHQNFDKRLEDFNNNKITAKTFWSDFMNGTMQKIKPLKEMMILLEELKKGYRLYALSNSTRDGAKRKLEDHGMSKYFEEVFTSFEIGHTKPDLEIFEHVLDKISLKPEECLFLDDIKENTASARILGFETLTVLDYKKLKKYLEFLGILQNHKL